MTTSEVLKTDKKLHDFLQDNLLRGRVEKLMEEYHKQKLSLCSVVHSAYLCKDVNGEDCMIVAENIADAFDKLEKITPCPEDVTVSGKSTRVYY